MLIKETKCYLLYAAAISMAVAVCCALEASAQYSSTGFSSLPTPTPTVSPVANPVISPVINPVSVPVMPILPPTVVPNLPILPTDLTNPLRILNPSINSGYGQFTKPTLNPGNAVKRLHPDKFPQGKSEQSEDGIIVRAISGSDFERTSPSTVDLTEGALFISVRKPATVGLIHTPHGSVSIGADADVIVRYENGVLRVLNLTGLGENVKVKVHAAEVSATVNGKSFGGPVRNEPIALALKVGHEIVSADRDLTHRDLHPKDGIGRRQYALVESQVLAVNEFSLETALNSCDLIIDLQQKVSGAKERRILGDMTKMAAVLNYMNGAEGFVSP